MLDTPILTPGHESKLKKIPELPITEHSMTKLYTIDYLRGNMKHTQIFAFPDIFTMQQVVDAAKAYCGNMNYRFVWAAETILRMPLGIPEWDDKL
jgi:hypothetical protein